MPEPTANDQADDDSGMLIGGIITSATGVVMLASGVAMVLVGEAHYADSAPFCSLSQFCEPSGLDLRKQARTEAIIGVVLGSAGLAATGIGAGMWIAASMNGNADSPDVQVGVRVSPAGLSLIGKW